MNAELFRVGGIDCPSCAAGISRAVGQLPGVEAVAVDVLKGEVRVTVAQGGATRAALAQAITEAGHPVRADRPGATEARPRGPLRAAMLSGVLLGVGVGLGWLGQPEVLQVPVLAGAMIAGGWYVVPRGLKALRNRSPDMHALMTIAAAGAAVIGEWGEGASAMFLFAVALLLEQWAVGRARKAIGALMELAPAEALVIRLGGDQRVAVEAVKVGERIRVRPGERVALDGTITAGRSALNEAPITGEAIPADKGPGDAVYAGSINGHGALEVRTTRPASDTTLARILHAVEDAQASRAPVQALVDRFARVYTPLVVGLAVLVVLVPPVLGLGGFETWLYRGLTLLVIACPCALVISTPVTLVSALTGAARAGVLLKGGAQLEALARVTAIAFDKTGTLTEGRPELTDVIAVNHLGEDEVLRLAASVERHSEHPVARAITRAAERRQVALAGAEEFAALPGWGARATVADRRLIVGNRRLCDEVGACRDDVHALLDRLEQEGKTAILVADGREPLGVVAVADALRPTAAAAVAALRAAGIRRLVMLTGDGRTAADRVAQAVGVAEVRARLLPEEKLAAVRALQQEGEVVAVVGDGVNDAPALAAATVGIAMGAAGTHAALETADVALMGDDLTLLAPTIVRARRTLAIIRQNMALALGLKAVFLVLALLGQATLWMAVAADMGASLLVIANGLRALPAAGRPA
ncbi:MAG: heavy metal translocating P-type ATPase [Gemmatimonadetes bacterium]|nr:heavy metal translocating P-type ATPase [Gemmatimonadota bacterium]